MCVRRRRERDAFFFLRIVTLQTRLQKKNLKIHGPAFAIFFFEKKVCATVKQMLPGEIEKSIRDNTLLEHLMDEVEIVHHSSGTVEVHFPDWYYNHISAESRSEIEHLVHTNIRCLSRTSPLSSSNDRPGVFSNPDDIFVVDDVEEVD